MKNNNIWTKRSIKKQRKDRKKEKKKKKCLRVSRIEIDK